MKTKQATKEILGRWPDFGVGLHCFRAKACLSLTFFMGWGRGGRWSHVSVCNYTILQETASAAPSRQVPSVWMGVWTGWSRVSYGLKVGFLLLPQYFVSLEAYFKGWRGLSIFLVLLMSSPPMLTWILSNLNWAKTQKLKYRSTWSRSPWAKKGYLGFFCLLTLWDWNVLLYVVACFFSS